MFALQFGALGAWLPVFSLHLQKGLGFSGVQIGTVLGVSSAAALFSPFLGAMVTDRLLSARKFLAVCQGLSGVMLIWCAFTGDFFQVLISMTMYQLMFTPSLALCNAIALKHIKGGRERYGSIRVWGTVSWMAIAWIVALLLKVYPQGTALALLTSVGCSFGLMALCFFLPSDRALVRPSRRNFLKFSSGVWKFFLAPEVIMLSLGSFLISMTFRFSFTGGGPYLVGSGCPVEWVLPALSMGQILELWFLFRLKHHLERWGYFGLMSIGAMACLFQFLGMSFNPPIAWAVFLMMGHGVTFTYFSTVLLMWMDTQVRKEDHSSVHQLVIFIPSLAGVVGGYLSGWMLESAEASGNYTQFYAVPAVAGFLTLSLVALAKFKVR